MSIPYGRQEITQADIDAVVEVLRSDFLTQGPMVPQFEQAIARYCCVQHAVAVNSATSALHLACLALGVRAGDQVWTSPITFVASANCARFCGADVGFVDIDPRTYNISVTSLAAKLEKAEIAGNLPKVVIPVHLGGQSCEMDAIHALSRRYGFRIIEDASHAIGGRYKNEPIGSCRYSDITIFSFHPVKIITTGEGGMALTNDPVLANFMARLRSHGITRDFAEMTGPPDGPWYYQQVDLGFNYRMTDMQAALGLSQLQRLDGFVAKRHAIAQRYGRQLTGFPVNTPWQHTDCYSGLHLYVVRLMLNRIGKTRREVFESLRRDAIGVNVHYIPVYRQPYYLRMGYQVEDYPEAERYYAEAISLPIYPGLTDDAHNRVINALRVALEQ